MEAGARSRAHRLQLVRRLQGPRRQHLGPPGAPGAIRSVTLLSATSLQPWRVAAMAAAIGFLAIAAFQVALALGGPLGRAAWGGSHVRLPMGLRLASAFAVVFWTVAALV